MAELGVGLGGDQAALVLGDEQPVLGSSSPCLIWGHIYCSTGTVWVLQMLPLLILMFCFNRDVFALWRSAYFFEVSLLGCPR